MHSPRFRHIMLPLLALAISACASRPDPSVTSDPAAAQTGTGAQSASALRVTVNLMSPDRSEMTVYIEPANGVRTMLGTLLQSEQKTFNFELPAPRIVRLVGVSPGSAQLTSPQITVPAGSGVYWDVSANTVRLIR